jgi:hypothetical protein
VFHTIWEHSGPFGCLMKLDAKQVELVQKFVPRSRVRSFRNIRTRYTPLDPKLTFWYVCIIWEHSGLFGYLMKLDAKRAKLVQKFVPRSRVRTFRNEHTRSTPLDLKLTFGAFRTIWVHSGPFGCLTKLGAKQAELVQKFVSRSCVGIFHNECTRSNPLDHKLTF